jgi:tetrahydromethanopterin S-methyltransferase subunit G
MKRLMIAGLAAASLAASFGAAEAQQRYGSNQAYGQGRGQPIEARLDRIEQRIDRGLYRGDLTRREAALLRRDLNNVANLHHRYAYDGLNRWEWEDLSRRVDHLQNRVRFERRDPDQRWDREDDRDYGYGYGDRRR